VRILFVSANRLGDAVITCGVLDHLIRTHPTASFTIACGTPAAGLFSRMPQLERVIVFDKHKNDSHWPKLWREVVFTWWDLVVDMRASALAFLIPAKRRAIRRKRPGRMFEQHAAMLGIDPAPLPVVWTAQSDRDRAAALLSTDRPVIGLGVTASWAGKVWPPEHFAALFERLSTGLLPGAVPAIFAGPGAAERALAAPALALLPQAIDLCGALTVPEAAAAIERCALFVGNDSGLMHLAAATGTPTVGLCGTTRDRAAEMAPAGKQALWAEADEPSMEALTVSAVAAACASVLT